MRHQPHATGAEWLKPVTGCGNHTGRTFHGKGSGPEARRGSEKNMDDAPASVRIDTMDRRIMAELQRDASQSLDEIARKVGSSKTPVWNRIRKLREAGII